jgi:hypothetical protein
VALFTPDKDGAPLALLTLGVVSDARPLPQLQPPLREGIHLRWAFDPTLGFPWFGFYLFRRITPAGTPICASGQFTGLVPGPRSSAELQIALGTFHSDQNLVLTDDFPPTGTVEIDLSGRAFVSFKLNPGQSSRLINVSIGFVADFPPAGSPPGTGKGPGDHSGGLGGTGATTGACGCGCSHAAIKPVVERVVALGPGQYRATFGYDNTGSVPVSMPVGAENRFFPDPQDRGQPTMFLSGRRAEAFSVVFDGRPLVWRLAGHTVTVSAADVVGSGGGGIGDGSGDGIVLTALVAGAVVAIKVVSGRASQVVTTPLAFEGIDEVRVSSGPARLVDVCVVSTADSLGQGWAPVPNFPQPMPLPVRGQQYPIRRGAPNLAESQALALARISYAFPIPGTTQLDLSEWTGDNFSQIHDVLSAIVASGPPGITEHIEHIVPADPDPSDPDAFQPTWTDQSSLALLLSASVNPAVAQMLGLYWVDDTTVEGQSYDYMLVADYKNAGNSNVNTILALLTTQNHTNIDAYLRSGAVRAATPPLAPPAATTLQAYALPLTSVPPSAPADSAGLVGVRWGVPSASDQTDKIAPTDAILFHVWRKDFGRSGPSAAETFDPESYTRETDFPMAPGEPRVEDPPAQPLDGWPSVSLFEVDGPFIEGWYSYRVSGIDIFGRHSARSELVPWLALDGTVLDDHAVQIIDTTPPPAPSRVQAWLLDPLDQFLLQDAAYTAWRTANPSVGVGLRVRWAWGAQQRRQAPDAREFRIYLHPGSQLDDSGDPLKWAQRIAIIGVSEQVLPQSLQPLQTQPTDPAETPEDIAGQSVSISGAQVTLNDGPALDSVRAGEAELQLVVDSVASQFAVVKVDAGNRVVTIDQSVEQIGTVTAWALLPLRTYEVFLPGTTLATPAAFTSPASPPRSAPVAYSLVGVSAADDKDRSDLRKGTQPLTPRLGNEGAIGGPATVVQVLRTPPDPPPAPFDQPSLSATRADFLSRSFFTLHAVKQPTTAPPSPAMAVHVYRALDETLFQIDAQKGFTSTKRVDEAKALSLTALGPTWTEARRTAAVTELGALTATTYAGLSMNALRLLASLPSNVAAFSCITRAPIPATTSDDRGLSDLPTYDPNARTDLLAFTDILDGRATNRYFYRTTLVDAAQNQSLLGVATPPVLLPPTAVPDPPSLETAKADEQTPQITLTWSTSRASSVVEYRIFRTDQPSRAQDIRLMDPPVKTIAEVAPPRPLTRTWTDQSVKGLVTYSYCIVAVDNQGGVSRASRVLRARAVDLAPPAIPTLTAAWTDVNNVTLAQVTWQSDNQTLLQERPKGASQWIDLGQWRVPGSYSIRDPFSDPSSDFEYRVLVRKDTGARAASSPLLLTRKS